LSLKQKRILVTGACGTVGKVLIRQLLDHHQTGELIALDNNESELFDLEQQFAEYGHANFFLADVRDRDRLNDKMKGIDWVFHTAAFKHAYTRLSKTRLSGLFSPVQIKRSIRPMSWEHQN
jgi:FlaA1/EpsC-like NDP-sugar epimerase